MFGSSSLCPDGAAEAKARLCSAILRLRPCPISWSKNIGPDEPLILDYFQVAPDVREALALR